MPTGSVFQQIIIDKLDSGTDIFWINMLGDEGRCERFLRQAFAAATPPLEFCTWDVIAGASWDPQLKDPAAAIAGAAMLAQGYAAIVLRDMHLLLNSQANFQLRRAVAELCKNNRLVNEDRAHPLIILADNPTPHPDIRDYCDVIDYDLPTHEELLTDVFNYSQESLRRQAVSPEAADCTDELRDRIVEKLLGLNATEADRILNYALMHAGGINESVFAVIAEEKAKSIAKINGLKFVSANDIRDESSIAGFEVCLDFVHKRKWSYTKHAQQENIPRPRGIALVGPPGCLHGDTVIYDPVDKSALTVGERHVAAREFHVAAMTADATVVTAKARPPVKYVATDMVTLTFASGNVITVSTGHLVQTNRGYMSAGSLCDAWQQQKLAAFRFPAVSVNNLASLLHDAPAMPVTGDMQIAPSAAAGIQQAACDQLSTVSCFDFFHGGNADGAECANAVQLSNACTFSCDKWIAANTAHTFDTLVAAEYAGVAEYYDFEVPAYSNYWAAGTFHHNTGKTMVAMAIAKILGLDLIMMDIGSMYDSLVGSSEKRIRQALGVVAAMPNCVLMVDEVDKALANAHTNAATDSGVSSRMLSYFLNWLSERSMTAADGNRTFVIVTMNRTAGLPPEMLRAGRFDRIFSTAMPDKTERHQHVQIQLERYGVDPAIYGKAISSIVNSTDGYSGAEIEEVVVAARHNALASKMTAWEIAADDSDKPTGTALWPSIEDLLVAVSEITPLSRLDKEAIDAITKFCQDRTTPVTGHKTAGGQRAAARIRTRKSQSGGDVSVN